MSNSGSPSPSADLKAAKQRGGWFGVILAALILVLGVLLVSQFIPILYGVLFPPEAPTPVGVIELTRDSTAYGFDTVVYASPEDACRTTRFYLSQGASCSVAPQMCDSGFAPQGLTPATQIARCTADVPFSIFTMRYTVEIIAGYGRQTPDQPSRLRMEREIFWSGAPRRPSATLTP